MDVKHTENLSPKLFLILNNILPEYLTSTLDHVILNSRHFLGMLMTQFLLLSSATGLQEKLNILHKKCIECCLNIDASKIQILIFNMADKL